MRVEEPATATLGPTRMDMSNPRMVTLGYHFGLRLSILVLPAFL